MILSDRALYDLGRNEALAAFLADMRSECLGELSRLDLATPEDQARALEVVRKSQVIDLIVEEISAHSDAAARRLAES